MNEREPAMANCVTEIGQVKEITHASRERIDTAKNIAGRLRELRVRLIGENGQGLTRDRNDAEAPEPLRAEIQELGHSMDTLRQVLEDALDDLAQLERL